MEAMTKRRSSPLCAAFLGLLLAACAQSPAKSPAPADRTMEGAAPAPVSREDAQGQLSVSERQLDQLLPDESDAAKGGAVQPSQPGYAPLPGSGDAQPMTAPPAEERADRCVIACKALGSMRRAADRLCELTGSDDSSCSDARARVDRSTARVHRHCPACAEAR